MMLPSPVFASPAAPPPPPTAPAIAAGGHWLRGAGHGARPLKQRHRCDACDLHFGSGEELDAHLEEHVPVSVTLVVGPR